MRRAIPPLPNTPSWRGTQFKKMRRTTLPLPYLYVLFLIVSLIGLAVCLLQIHVYCHIGYYL